MKTIAAEWETYLAMAYPQGVSPIQAQETRRAFLAGVVVMIGLWNEIASQSISEDAAVVLLEKVWQETMAMTKDELERDNGRD